MRSSLARILLIVALAFHGTGLVKFAHDSLEHRSSDRSSETAGCCTHEVRVSCEPSSQPEQEGEDSQHTDCATCHMLAANAAPLLLQAALVSLDRPAIFLVATIPSASKQENYLTYLTARPPPSARM